MSSSELSDDEEPQTWIEWFCQLRGHEFFCDVDTHYIADAFNLYGLRNQVPRYKQCLELLLGYADSGSDREGYEQELYPYAKKLYGLIHQRYILTAQGQRHMLHKYEFGDFGTCPRVLCGLSNVLPIGEHSEVGKSTVKLFCPQCQDVYEPPRKSHREVDGAFFGPSFPHLLMMVKPDSFTPKPFRVYTPRIYGFRVYKEGRNYPLLDRSQTPAAARVQAWSAEVRRTKDGSSKHRRSGRSATAAAAPATAGGGSGRGKSAAAAATAVAGNGGGMAVGAGAAGTTEPSRSSRKRKSGPQ